MNIQQIRQASLITAIKTPFNEVGKIDLSVYDKLVEKQIDAGVQGLVVAGTTGEGHLLNWEEHLMLIAHTASSFGDKLVVIGNTGSNNTREAIRATEHGFASGMHAALQINPYYGKTSAKGVETHLRKGLDVGPVFIYNVEARTGQDIPPEIIESIATHPNFIGVKECGGNKRIAHYENQGIACWSGNDDECFDGKHKNKSHGVISVTSNLLPGLMKRLMDSADESVLNQQLQPLFDWLFCEPNPIAINTALGMTGAIKPVFRLPYMPLDAKKREIGYKLLNSLNSNDYVGDNLSLLTDDEFKVVV
ncbi:MAG: 4-hydroxy-tetrahydrodipicolinate synthase [Polaribacter sp.]|jgi:4-hydroxy-tetrahydrodipicolinate synthase